MQRKALIIGACGQIGIELTMALRQKLGAESVVASDVKETCPPAIADGPYVQLSVLDFDALRQVLIKYQVTEVYNMAALLSATSEKNPAFAYFESCQRGIDTTSFLAKLHRCFRSHNSTTKYTTRYHHGSQFSIWYIEIGRRTLV